jgi:hypothetical protein
MHVREEMAEERVEVLMVRQVPSSPGRSIGAKDAARAGLAALISKGLNWLKNLMKY